MSEELETLKRIETLLAALVKAKLSDEIGIRLKDPKRKPLYELTGKGTVRDLARKTGFSIGQISKVWQEWEQAGLLIKDGKQYKKVF